jgi:UDP-N-acetylmuramoyl-L-alanyl-D-glutamate--2,6-diaminopimelate ligase
MEDYRAAKRQFCESLVAAGRHKPNGVLVYSCDDPVANDIGAAFTGRKVAVGTGGDVRLAAADTGLDATTLELDLAGGERVGVRMKLLGTFVPANAALAAAAATELGAEPVDVVRGLESIEAIPGRFEALGGAGRPVVIVDYSHTADAFERVLTTCRELGPDRITVVFGCGGDRDRSKRPLIGAVAERLADRCIITTDNPRTEIVEDIVAGIKSGMSGAGNVTVELDRAAAIATAVADAGARDLVALLGKGHEPYQIIGTTRTPWSDRREAEHALENWGKQ